MVSGQFGLRFRATSKLAIYPFESIGRPQSLPLRSRKAQKVFYFIRSTNSETTQTPPTIIGVRSANRVREHCLAARAYLGSMARTVHRWIAGRELCGVPLLSPRDFVKVMQTA